MNGGPEMRRTVWAAAALAAVASLACAGARAVDLETAADAYIKACKDLDDALDKVKADRASMEANLSNADALRAEVAKFFRDRFQAHMGRVERTAARKLMRKVARGMGYDPPELKKPSKPSGNLVLDAAEYIEAWKEWKSSRQQVRDAEKAIEDALNSGDSAALMNAVESYFDARRYRHEARLMWQSRLKAMKKAVGFKGTGSPSAPAGNSLADFAAAYLYDRDEWKTLSDKVDDDRDAIEANLGDENALWNAVVQFFVDRRLLHLKTRELALDRKAMRKELGGYDFGFRIREKFFLKLGEAFSIGSVDKDEEQKDLDETINTVGAG